MDLLLSGNSMLVWKAERRFADMQRDSGNGIHTEEGVNEKESVV